MLLLFGHYGFAQDISGDLEFIETQNTLGSPYNIPIYFDIDGNMSLFSNKMNASLSLGPLAHTIWSKNSSQYIRPVRSSEFSFDEQDNKMGWIEVKRNRWEAGLGLEATMASNIFALGLTPFKGAKEVVIRYKDTHDEETEGTRLPDKLDDFKDWRLGDSGTFQRYGGVSIYAGLSYSFVNIATAGITIQNLFSLNIKKISDSKIHLTIAEEHLKNRRLQAGVTVATAQANFIKGNKVSTFFILDLKEPSHFELYRFAIRGKLHILQEKLPQESQHLNWTASERKVYVGIPGVIGKNFQRSEYDFNVEDKEDVVDIKMIKNSGILLPMRNHKRIVYQSDKGITLFWISEMNRAKIKHLKRAFIDPGKIMGARGFDQMLPSESKIGSTMSQLGMSFDRQELEAVSPQMLEEILIHFKNRCEAMKLDCRTEHKQKKITRLLKQWTHQKWENMRDNLGFLLIEEPALIFCYLKAIKSKKTVYFKFLNQKFQSLEGMAPIDI